MRKADQASDRRQDIIHPSEMASHEWCPRRTYYRIRDVRAGRAWTPERHSAGTLAIFEEGHFIHRKWQGWLREMGVLKGRWDCLECARKGVAYGLDPGSCPECSSVVGVVYGEVPLDATRELLIAGSSDGWVGDSLIEIKGIATGTLRIEAPELLREHTHKTIGGKEIVDINGAWEALSRPLPAHIRQGQIYLHLAALIGVPVDTITYLYECKVNQQVKEFTIRRSERIVRPLLEKAETIANAIRHPDEAPIPDRAFDNPDKRPCKTCEFAKECYAENSAAAQQSRSSERSAAGGAYRQPGRSASASRFASHAPQGRDGAVIPGSDDLVRGDDRVGRTLRGTPGTGGSPRRVRRIAS